MRPQTQTVTRSGSDIVGSPIRMNFRQNAFKIGIQAVVTSGSPSYGVQYTLDDPANFTDETDYGNNANWFNLINEDFPGPSGVISLSAQTSNIVVPIQSIRGQVTTTDGAVDFTFLQGNAW